MNKMHRPIRHRLFGGLPGRQACAAGWAQADSWRQAQRAVFLQHQGRSKKKGQSPPGLHESPLRHGQNVVSRHDQVIQHPHIHQR